VRPPPLARVLVTLAVAVPIGGCAWSAGSHPAGAAGGRAGTPAAASPSRTGPRSLTDDRPPLPSRPDPAAPLAVGVRKLALARGADRPLPTTVWYPAAGAPGRSPRPDAPVAAGRFPLVLFSHGLDALPANLAAVGTRWAAAGFVVAAPAYPHTVQGTRAFDVRDVVNQPADASYVISQLLATSGPLAGQVDPAAVAAAGHSAGGYTTTFLLSSQRDPRLRAAIVIAGALLGGDYTGPATPVLFVHGDADPTVSYRNGGRPAYAALPWPKAFLTVLGGDHGRYLAPGNRGFDEVVATTTDFLRWTLYGDVAARGRLSADGTATGVTGFEAAW
jgi:dienelactone hydrolase